jgi:hypothetical protein
LRTESLLFKFILASETKNLTSLLLDIRGSEAIAEAVTEDEDRADAAIEVPAIE